MVPLSGSYGAQDVDLSVSYCPRCDVAFVFLSPTKSPSVPVVLQWHRHGSQLEIRIEDRPHWEKLPHQFREAWESNVRYHVKGFLAGRFSEAIHCPMDGGRIPVISKPLEESGTPMLFAWCSFCDMGFLYARDDQYGWELFADVVRDADRKTYLLGRQYATGGNHAAKVDAKDLPALRDIQDI
jgi:hypothetical protein